MMTPVRIPFTKMHGLGNDFVMLAGPLVNDVELHPDHHPERLRRLAVYLCDRHFGVGADGLILPAPPTSVDKGDVRFVYINSDGSVAEMCGNGIRCFALYVKDAGLVRDDAFTVETLAGPIRPRINADRTVTVDMGPPFLAAAKVPFKDSGVAPDKTALRHTITVNGTPVPVTAIGMGNPHCLIFQEDLPQVLDPAVFGPLIETHPSFPAKTNVEFIETISRQHLKVTVWERGCGFTLACGTGACATAVAAMLLGKVDNTVNVELPGGILKIEWSGQAGDPVMMSGPATRVFEGEIELPSTLLDEISVGAQDSLLAPQAVV
jgi:diaminopimelate epimerase